MEEEKKTSSVSDKKSTTQKKSTTAKSTTSKLSSAKPTASTAKTAKSATPKSSTAKLAEKTATAKKSKPVAKSTSKSTAKSTTKTVAKSANEPTVEQVPVQPDVVEPQAVPETSPTEEITVATLPTEQAINPVETEETQAVTEPVVTQNTEVLFGDSENQLDGATVEDDEPIERERKNIEVKKNSFIDKTNAFIKEKGSFPLFIVVNALLFIGAIVLMLNSFYFKHDGKYMTYNIFQYLKNGDTVKSFLANQAGEWANGAYTLLGILSIVAILVPIALVIKNVLLFVLKGNKNIYNYDAIIVFSLSTLYIVMLNMFGAYISFGQVLSFAISALVFVFTVFSLAISKSSRKLPIYSIANIVLCVVAGLMLSSRMFTFTYNGVNYALYAANASAKFSGGAFAFLCLFVAACLLVFQAILQMKKIPGVVGKIVDIVVPLAAFVFTLISFIMIIANKSNVQTIVGCDISVGVGYIIGVALTAVIAIADTLITFVKPIKKYKVTVAE